GGLALVFIAELVTSYVVGMPLGEGVMPVVQVGAVPRNAELVEPGGAEFDFKTFAEIAFGLRIEMDASSDVHTLVGSLSLRSSGFGRRVSRGSGVTAKTGLCAGAARTAGGMLVAAAGATA